MKAEAQAFLFYFNLAAEEWLEEVFHRRCRNRNAFVRNPNRQQVIFVVSMKAHGLARRPMRDGISKQVGNELANARWITLNRCREVKIRLYGAIGASDPQFGGHMLEDWREAYTIS